MIEPITRRLGRTSTSLRLTWRAGQDDYGVERFGYKLSGNRNKTKPKQKVGAREVEV